MRFAGVVLVGLLLAVAFIQTNRINDNVDRIRGIVNDAREAQVKGCGRGNLLRSQVNRNVEVLDAFIREAVKARRASGDNQIADQYARLLPKLEPLDLVNCQAAFPRPPGH